MKKRVLQTGIKRCARSTRPPLNFGGALYFKVAGWRWHGCLRDLKPGETREGPVPSLNYAWFEQAIRMRKQIVCMYGGYLRELCPIILGHSQAQEKALTYQFGDQSKSGLPPQ